jgi:putative FmdB family regulatory protein
LPLYEYLCRACGHRFEQIQKFSDPIQRKCPKCKKPKLEKLLSAPAVQFKGTGWYVTDYAAKKPGSDKGDSADKGSDKSSEKSASSEKGGKSDGGKSDSGSKSGKDSSRNKSSKD